MPKQAHFDPGFLMDQVHRCLDPAEHGKNQRQENDKDIKNLKSISSAIRLHQ